MNIKKKLIYTIFTAPFCMLTFNAYRWQLRRKSEKVIEMKIRELRLEEEGVKLNEEVLRKFKINEEWEFKPVILRGYFSDDYVLVNRTRENETGFHIVSLFYCYKDEAGVVSPVIVDKGWIPYNHKENFFEHFKTGNLVDIKGIMYKGDKKNKYSLASNHLDEDRDKLISMNPEEISQILKLENKNVSSQFIVKEVDFELSNKMKGQKTLQYPIRVSYNDLMVWYITPEKHQNYANFWITVTVMNIISNIFVWTYL